MTQTNSPQRWPQFKRSDLVEVAALTILLIMVRVLPRWLLGADSYVTIHDNLDSDFAYRVLINEPGRLFDYSGQVDEMLGGLPRWTFPSGLKFSSLVFHWLSPLRAYIVLEQSVSLIGAWGMWLLLRDFAPSLSFYRAGIAISFGLLPFMPIYDCSVSGQPLVLWAMLSAWHRRNTFAALLVCIGFSFFSVLQMSGLFVVAEALICVFLAAIWYRRTRPWRTLAWPVSCAVALGFGYLVTDFGFLRHYLMDNFTSHREGFALLRSAGPIRLDVAMRVLLHGRYHAASHHEAIAILAVVAVLVLVLRRRLRSALKIFALCLLAVPVSFSMDLFRWPGLSALAQLVPSLGQVTPRFWWSLPLLWYLIWGLVAEVWPRGRWGQSAFAAFFAYQVYFCGLKRGELLNNYELVAAHFEQRPPSQKIATYRQFTSPHAVRALKHYLGDQPGRILCLGFHPSVLHLGGLNTVDGYRDLYPLEYKNKFRSLMAEDLSGNAKLEKYFETFGSRVYYFYPKAEVSGFSKKPFRSTKPQVIRMNLEAAEDLEIEWVVSTFRIRGPAKKFLDYKHRFIQPGGFVFHLYEVEYR